MIEQRRDVGRLREVLRLSRTAVLALAGAAIAAAVAVFVLTRDRGLPDPDPVAVIPADARDPFAYDEARRADFERRAAAGHAHTLYAKSPGGVVESARRTAALRAEVERAAPAAGVSPELLEAIVFLESAGRPGAVADPKLEGAVGLTQILAETGRNLLGMKVDTRASRRLTRRIGRAERAGNENRAARLRARRQRVDERFDPRKALEATGRYLTLARGSFGGREDFGVAAYHMGIGNLRSVIRDFGGAPRSYAEVFFATSPTERAAAWRRLSDLGDDSSTYLWRVYAAREIMREYREDSDALADKADLYTAKNSAEEVLHPEDDTETFDDPDELEAAYRDGAVRSFPQAPRSLGLRRDARMGELAQRLEREPRLYRGLRPDAYALAAYAAWLTRRAGGGSSPLTVTSTVRDGEYQDVLAGRNPEATANYSLHTTGYAFDVSRTYASRAQARAFQFALDRLQSLDLIAWVREPAAIHVTAGPGAARLTTLLREP